jgi:hypothetical protein
VAWIESKRSCVAPISEGATAVAPGTTPTGPDVDDAEAAFERHAEDDDTEAAFKKHDEAESCVAATRGGTADVAHGATQTSPDDKDVAEAPEQHGKAESTLQPEPEVAKETVQPSAKETAHPSPEDARARRVDPTIKRWSNIQQNVSAKSELAEATTPGKQPTGADNLYTNRANVRRDDTPLGPEVNNRTHTVPEEHGTPLDPAIVERRRRAAHEERREYNESSSEYDCPSSDTERAHARMVKIHWHK